VAGAEGRWEHALRLAAAAAAAVGAGSPRALVLVYGLPDPAGVEPVRAQARSALGDPAFAAAWAEGQELSLEQAVAYALEDAPEAT
jgi:hypothetical protein